MNPTNKQQPNKIIEYNLEKKLSCLYKTREKICFYVFNHLQTNSLYIKNSTEILSRSSSTKDRDMIKTLTRIPFYF